MSCLDDEQFRRAFQQSNVPTGDVARWARCVDDMLAAEGMTASAIHGVDVSLADMFMRADGQSSATTNLMLVLHSIGIVLLREAGLFKKKTQSQTMFFSDHPNLHYESSEREQGPGWGWYHLHALTGSGPLFTFGWPWSSSGADPRRHPSAASGERDRVLDVLLRTTPRR